MLTPEVIMQLDLPLESVGSKECLYINTAFDWLLSNTTLNFDKNNIESVKALPSSAKAFLFSFVEIMSQSSIVTSESIAGMSQSFNTRDKGSLLRELAVTLLGDYYKSVKFAPCTDRWRATLDECEVEDREE